MGPGRARLSNVFFVLRETAKKSDVTDVCQILYVLVSNAVEYRTTFRHVGVKLRI